MLQDVAAGEGASRLKRTTPAPLRQPVAYAVEGRQHSGDLYRPAAGAKAALVLVPGAAKLGKDDPRLVALAMTLARARFAVLVPEIANLRELKVRAADIGVIADAIRHLSNDFGGAPVGVVAISYAAGPALLATLRQKVRPRVRFIVAIGGYHAATDVLTFFTTGKYREASDGPWRYRRPNAYGKWVFARSNAELLSQPRDREALADIAARKIADLDADVGDLAKRLGPEGRAVYALLRNTNPDRTPALIASLPLKIRQEISALDLQGRDLSPLPGTLFLVHGREDRIIPYTQSRALYAAAPEPKALYLVDSLAHVRLDPSGLIDALRLWRMTYRLLGERDAAER